MFNSAQKDEKILHFCQNSFDIQRLCTMDIMWTHLCSSPITDDKVTACILCVNDGPMEADGSPTCVGHLCLVSGNIITDNY